MLQHVLDAALQCHGGGRTARTGTLHVEEHDAFLIALEGDVAAVLRNGRTDTRVENFLDLRDDLAVLAVVTGMGIVAVARCEEDRRTAGEPT